MTNLQNTAAKIIARALEAEGVIEGSCWWLTARGTLADAGVIAAAIKADLQRVNTLKARAEKYGPVYAESVQPAIELALYSAHEGMAVFIQYCDSKEDVAALWKAAWEV